MKPPHVNLRSRGEARRGFALLVTITLVAFLVLLLVSIATLTRVETQVTLNSQQQSQARQNALMALNVALGELQKYAGPDQRTTATADIDAALADDHSRSGRWLGVYGSGVAANYDDAPGVIAAKLAADAAAGPANGSQARLLNWLVSGNEGTSFNPTSAVGSRGEILSAPSTFRFSPNGTVSGITPASDALSTGLTINDSGDVARPARLLVGPNTVGADAANASLDGYVVAPLRDISAVAPGAGDDEVAVGRYAWWVGDEGAKARVNLPAPSTAQAANGFVSALRAGVELVDYRNPSGTTTMIATDMLDPSGAASRYDPDSSALPNVLSTSQLPMISAAQHAALRQTIQYRFHDLTASSRSVLSDAYAGGLKKDLSARLSSEAASPLADDYLFQPEPGHTYAVPTWGQLRSFATMRTPADGMLLPRLPTATETGVSPVLTYAAVGFQYVSSGEEGAPIQLALFPIAVLWNPYTATLRGARYEMGVARRWSATVQLQAHTPGKTSEWTIKETRDFTYAGGLVTGGAAPNADGSANLTSTATGATDTSGGRYLRFVIDASNVDLAPGESRVFTLNGGQTYSAPMSGEPANELKPGLRVTGHAVLPTASWVAAGESVFRVGIYGRNDANRTLFSPASVATHFSGSESDFYLGAVASSGPVGYGPVPGGSGTTKPWYQNYSRMPAGTPTANRVTDSDPQANNAQVGSILQGPAPLPSFASSPEFAIGMFTIFSNSSSSASVRWIAQSNPRATLLTRAKFEGGVSGRAGFVDGTQWQRFTLDPSGRVSSGAWLDSGTAITDTTLFEHLPEDRPLMSVGQLQHANLSLIGSYPAYPLGNSLADFRLNFHSGSGTDYRSRLHRADGSASTSSSSPSHLITAYYDVSYLLNRALWDRCFVSTVPHAGTGAAGETSETDVPDPLANPRLARQTDASVEILRDADRAASGLMLEGGFNINSTSEQAWRAVLGGINRLPYDPVESDEGAPLRAALPRFSRPTPVPDAESAQWQGYRALDEAQIAQLARNIVQVVRQRGPFVSLGDFVNRRLRDNPSTVSSATTSADERARGVIQQALDATVTGPGAVNPGGTGPFTAEAPFTTKDSAGANIAYFGGTYADLDLMRGGPAYVAPYSSRAAFAPQNISQADVLSAIGAGLSARSDTFLVRTYGETVNPALDASDPDYITGRAWCEAIIQRIVEPVVRRGSDPDSPDYHEPLAGTATQPDFGRRFKVVAFRWLDPSDI